MLDSCKGLPCQTWSTARIAQRSRVCLPAEPIRSVLLSPILALARSDQCSALMRLPYPKFAACPDLKLSVTCSLCVTPSGGRVARLKMCSVGTVVAEPAYFQAGKDSISITVTDSDLNKDPIAREQVCSVPLSVWMHTGLLLVVVCLCSVLCGPVRVCW